MDRANDMIKSIIKSTEQATEHINEEKRIEKYYQQKDSNHLENIESNTASLIDVVTLLRQNNEHQTEIKELIFEILSIAVLEAEPERVSKYEQWRKKVADLGSAITGVKLLHSIGAAIFLGTPS